MGLQIAALYSGERSRKESREAVKKRERQSQLQSSRDAMAQVRQQRIAQAQILQAGGTQGTMSSSAVQGGYSAVGSLTSGNMQFLNQMDSLNSQIASHMRKSDRWANNAGTFTALSNMAAQGVGMMPSGSTPQTPQVTQSQQNAFYNATQG